VQYQEGEPLMARPSRGNEPATAAIRVRVTPNERREIEQVARDNRTDLAGLIREAVDEYVADYREKCVFRSPK
jgi:hypothetical protein